MTLAIGLAKAGITSHVVDNSDPAAQTAEGFDGRASAISTASWNLYTHLGLADELAPKGCPIAAFAVTDAMKPGRIALKRIWLGPNSSAAFFIISSMPALPTV